MSQPDRGIGQHLVSYLESGCQELEAIVFLATAHRAIGASEASDDKKHLAKGVEEALVQLAIVRVHALLFDDNEATASLRNFIKRNPIDCATEKLYSDICAVIQIIPGDDGRHEAVRLSMDQVRERKELIDYSKERSDKLKQGHEGVCRRFNELMQLNAALGFETLRHNWLAHASSSAGKMRFWVLGDEQTHAFLQRCVALLRSAVETYRPAVFLREGRETWARINQIAEAARANEQIRNQSSL